MIRETLSDLVQSLISLVLGSGAGFFVVPLLTIFSVVRFLRWAVSQSRGTPDIDDLQEQSTTLRRRAEAAPDRARRAFRRRF